MNKKEFQEMYLKELKNMPNKKNPALAELAYKIGKAMALGLNNHLKNQKKQSVKAKLM